MMAKNWKGVGSYGTLGLEIGVAIVLGLLGGRWLDGKLETTPYLSIAGFLLGIVTAGRAVMRAMKEMKRETEREEREEGNPAPLFDDEPEKDKADKDSEPPNPPPESPDDRQR